MTKNDSNARASSKAHIGKYVPSGELCLGGVPGKNQGPAERILHRTSGEPAYPWRRHFHRGYPDGDVDRWMKEFGRLD